MGKFSRCTLALASFLLASCHQLHDCLDEQMTSCRNSHLAKCAWCRCRGNYVDCQDNLWDFGSGFRYGYADILNGGRGCPPAFAPRSYWGCCYNGPEGKCEIAAWYDGFHHGAAAALADGYGADYAAVPSSIDVGNRCCRRPVQIDIEQYKASMNARLSSEIEEDVTPLPSEMATPVIPAPPEEPYSPRSLEAPADPTLPDPVDTPRQN